jgi:hypothetical protein
MVKDDLLDPQPVLGALHYALMCLEKKDIAGAKHGIHEALFRMGFTAENLKMTPQESKKLERQKAKLHCDSYSFFLAFSSRAFNRASR